MTVTDHAQAASPADQKKERKKLAKREARLMLKIEEGKKEAQKAEQKVARAQQRLEEAQVALHNLEMQLQQVQRALDTIPGKKKNENAANATDEQPPLISSAPILEELTDTPVTNTLEQEHAALHAGSSAQAELAPEPVPLQDILQEHTPETISAIDNSHAKSESHVSVDQPQAQEEEGKSSPPSSTEETPTAQDQAETQEEDETDEQEETPEHETSTGRSHRRRRSSNT